MAKKDNNHLRYTVTLSTKDDACLFEPYDIQPKLEKMIQKIAKTLEAEILYANVSKSYITCIVKAPATIAPACILNALKSWTATMLWSKYKEILQIRGGKKGIWSKDSNICTLGYTSFN